MNVILAKNIMIKNSPKGIKPTIEEKDEEKQLDVALKWIKEQISK